LNLTTLLFCTSDTSVHRCTYESTHESFLLEFVLVLISIRLADRACKADADGWHRETGHMGSIRAVPPCGTSAIVGRMTSRSLKMIAICIAVSALSPDVVRDSQAKSDCSKQECEKTRQKIAKIESKMRQGYRASQGVKMDDELRRLRKLRSKQCR
jgi:hypothetical protein